MNTSWDPFPNYKDIRFESLHDDCEGMRVILTGYSEKYSNRQPLRILFLIPDYYRKTDESRLIADKQGLENGDAFHVSEKSELIDAHQAASEGTLVAGIKHYGIYTENECIDVLSYCEPVCEALWEREP